jgi:hypothetical protein
VGHELDPERGQHVEERRLLVVAAGVDRRARQAVALAALLGFGLRAGEQPAADHLGIGLEQVEAVAVTVARELLLAELGEGHLELHVARERLVRGAHQRVLEVVADAGQGAGADEIAAADLRLIAAHRVVLGMALGQPHLRPHLQRGAADAVAAPHVHLIGAAGVEQVELDQLDPLVLEIEQGAVDAPAVLAQVVGLRSGAAAGVSGRPVVLPVDPGELACFHGALATAAASRVLADLAEKSLAAIFRDGP